MGDPWVPLKGDSDVKLYEIMYDEDGYLYGFSKSNLKHPVKISDDNNDGVIENSEIRGVEVLKEDQLTALFLSEDLDLLELEIRHFKQQLPDKLKSVKKDFDQKVKAKYLKCEDGFREGKGVLCTTEILMQGGVYMHLSAAYSGKQCVFLNLQTEDLNFSIYLPMNDGQFDLKNGLRKLLTPFDLKKEPVVKKKDEPRWQDGLK